MAYDIIVIGGGPAGLSAAINARARGRSVLVISNPPEESLLWAAPVIENYPGLPGISGAELLRTMQKQAEDCGVVFRTGKVISAMSLPNGWFVSLGMEMESAKALVLAAGVSRGKKYPGESEFLGRGVSYCATCDGMLYRGKTVAILGYTEAARREVDFLQELQCTVHYFHRPRHYEIHGGEQVESITCDGETVAVNGIFILRPTTAPDDLFPGLALEDGYVRVDRNMATNLPGLFAAGDCTGAPLQVAKAVGEGLIAGQRAAAYAAEQTQTTP